MPDNTLVTLIATFWHPRFGLVLWHTDEYDQPFIMWMHGLPAEMAQQTSDGYVDLLNAPPALLPLNLN